MVRQKYELYLLIDALKALYRWAVVDCSERERARSLLVYSESEA